MSSSPAEVMTVRPLGPGDAEAAAAINRELERVLGYPPAASAIEIRDWWATADLTADSWALEEDGSLVAFCWLELTANAADVGGGVHPRALGRGLGTRLVELSEARARELGASGIHQHVYEADGAARRLLEGRGYHAARRFYEMAVELTGELEPPAWPEGIRPETFTPETARAYHEAITESFAGEWGFVQRTFDEWHRLRVEGADTSLYLLARDGDEIAGVIRCEPERRGKGWVAVLGVRPAWRRRGIGRALLLQAFAAFAERGVRQVGLGVDAENPTGATRLYESVGMTVQLADVVYEHELS